MRADKKDAKALIDCWFAAYEYRAELERYDNRNARRADMDGMPRQHGAARGLDSEIIKEQNAEERLHEKHAAFLRAQQKALRALDRIIMYQPQQGDYIKGMRAFLKLYYIDDMPLKAAWREANVTERTARRYKSEIIRAANSQKKPG